MKIFTEAKKIVVIFIIMIIIKMSKKNFKHLFNGA